MIVKDPQLLKRMHAEAAWCELCGKGTKALQCHHIFGRGHGGGSRLDVPFNLVMLCSPGCHEEAQAYRLTDDFGRKLPRAEQQHMLCGVAAVREVYRLQRIPKEGAT